MFKGSDGGQFHSSDNASSRGRQGSRGRGSNHGWRDRSSSGRNGGGRGGTNRDNKSGSSRRAPCQIYGKSSHEARDCWYHYDEDDNEYQSKSAGAAAGYGVDTNWYADSGATDHITSDLKKMTVRDKYGGQDQVHTASGAGMKISNIGYLVLHTPRKNLHLKNILHVLVLIKACYLFIALHLIITPSLNFTQTIFLSRIGTRRKFCTKEDVRRVFTLLCLARRVLCWPSKLMESINCHRIDGTIVWVIQHFL
jgi:hypothetical protein